MRTLRRVLDGLYLAGGVAGACFTIAILGIIVAQMVTVASLGLMALHLPFWGLYVLDLGWGLGAGLSPPGSST